MPRSILIPVDGSENSEKAFNFYVDNLMIEEDTILILHVASTPSLPTFSFYEPMKMPTEEWTKKIQEQVEASQKLMTKYEMLCESKKLKKKTLIESGKPGEAICNAAQKENASMIVMGSRGLNALRRTFVGSVSDYVLHHTNVPVTVVPPK